MATTVFRNRNDPRDAVTGALTITPAAGADSAIPYTGAMADARTTMLDNSSSVVSTKYAAYTGAFVSTDYSLGRTGDSPVSCAVSFYTGRRLVFRAQSHGDPSAVVKLQLGDGSTWHDAVFSDSSVNNVVGCQMEITADTSASLWRLRCTSLAAGASVSWAITEPHW